jgi:succinate dehydrogenase/fumarate reductase cytochrome b subunit
MRALKIVSGIAVLLVAMHMIHGIHHVVSDFGIHGAGMWALVVGAAIVDVFAIIGGVLLLRSGS